MFSLNLGIYSIPSEKKRVPICSIAILINNSVTYQLQHKGEDISSWRRLQIRRDKKLPSLKYNGAVYQYRGNQDVTHIAHHVKNKQNLKLPMKLKWKYFQLNVGIHTASKSSPVVDQTSVYVGADNGRLYAFDKYSGKVKWIFVTRPCKNGIHGTPAVDLHHVYIGDYGGWMYCLNKSNGNLKWESKLGQSIGASPILVGERLYATIEVGLPRANGYLTMLDRSTGDVLFYSDPFGDHSHCTPTISNQRVYLGANTGRFHCLDMNTGRELWHFNTRGQRARKLYDKQLCKEDSSLCTSTLSALQNTGEIKGTASIVDDIVVFGSWDMYIYGLNATTGHEIWSYRVTGLVMSSSAIDTKHRRVYIGSHSKIFYCLNLDSGHHVWSYETQGRLMSSPILVPVSSIRCTQGIAAVFGSFDTIVYILCAENGQVLSELKLGMGAISNEISFNNKSLYISTNKGYLVKLDGS
ncbi:unnamed protein product [Didymodactylos carnosus]|uniref:Pyrrolo-quinoline quinone repeat domain-containing protein n=1 Tax=Didymodactylos carnosus TaxID=1234261 RepID=A0A814MDI3_9BILA|nr:unnamed protein product [Didymodactylos carnosus]CAF1075085.1 unnamed protein product [Didymodactylos carnosus]CAF3690402.1 unnamed protein product [Didymodactylos carnosus]CAF3841735.1 unnamed protein product [Didymodactylos carnosus]